MIKLLSKVETNKFYSNAKEDKLKILKENKGKSGIYKWNNKITNKSYIGSTVDLGNRLKFYYYSSNLERVLSNESSLIYSAILKYNLSKFSLEIIEYCKKEFVIEREQYYMNLFNPEYNILKKAGSRLGHKLSEETKDKLRIKQKGENNKRYGQKHTMESKNLMSIALRGRKLLVNSKSLIKLNSVNEITDLTRLKLSLRNQGVTVKIYNKFSNILINEFSSMKSAAKYMNVDPRTLSRIFDTGISYDDFFYKFEIKDLRIFVYDINNKLINVLGNKKKVSEVYNIPRTTLSSYIKSGKLFAKKYYFREREENI